MQDDLTSCPFYKWENKYRSCLLKANYFEDGYRTRGTEEAYVIDRNEGSQELMQLNQRVEVEDCFIKHKFKLCEDRSSC